MLAPLGNPWQLQSAPARAIDASAQQERNFSTEIIESIRSDFSTKEAYEELRLDEVSVRNVGPEVGAGVQIDSPTSSNKRP